MKKLSFLDLKSMNDQRVFVKIPDCEDMYALVAYHACEQDGDNVFLTNNIGGRSTYKEVVDQGCEIYLCEGE